MTHDPTALEVEQIDRDAAADCYLAMYRHDSAELVAQLIQGGTEDHWSIVQAFARHRITALSQARDAALEEAAGEADDHKQALLEDGDDYAELTPQQAEVCREKAQTAGAIADRIRTLKVP